MPMAASLHSPPSLPPTDINCSITEFCETYNLGDHAKAGLEKLGFRFGDDLTTVTSREIVEVGFKLLEWRRVLKAYRKLKLDSHDLLLHTVGQKTVPMFGCFAKIEVEQIKKIR